MTQDELERFTVKVASTMSTVVHRTVMEYILPKARQGWVEVPEVEYSLLRMADAFKVLDDPEVQKRMEEFLSPNPERERALVMAALGASFGESFEKDENGVPLSYVELREAKIAAVFRIVERAYPTE